MDNQHDTQHTLLCTVTDEQWARARFETVRQLPPNTNVATLRKLLRFCLAILPTVHPLSIEIAGWLDQVREARRQRRIAARRAYFKMRKEAYAAERAALSDTGAGPQQDRIMGGEQCE